MALHGVDVSSYQPNWSPGANEDFVFIKASEGTSYRNPYGFGQAARARAHGLVVGWYHFLQHGNIDAQANHFVNTAGIQAGDLLVCDWEAQGCTNADKDEFIRAVKGLRPRSRVGLYCNTSWWKTIDKTSYCGDFLWIAAYGVPDPGIKHEHQFWQYSDKPIDQNHGYFGTRAALKAWAGGDPQTQHGAKPPAAPHRLWYPLDSGSWSHTKAGVAIARPSIAAETESTVAPAAAEDGGLGLEREAHHA